MEKIATCSFGAIGLFISSKTTRCSLAAAPPFSYPRADGITSTTGCLSFQLRNTNTFYRNITTISKKSSCLVARAKKMTSDSEISVKPTIIDEVSEDDDEGDDLLLDDDDFEGEDDEDQFEDEYLEEEAEVYTGDGAAGGGVSLAGTSWDDKALALAEEACQSFGGELGIYAFRTLANSTIQVRIEKLSTNGKLMEQQCHKLEREMNKKSSSPTMIDIEEFTSAYRAKLDEAELAKSIPDNVTLEVSSPGVERVVRIPQDLDRFEERPMYVKYAIKDTETRSLSEGEGIFRLVSFDPETKNCTWGLANVRINREKAGKGRPMNKKQREWRLVTSFDSLHLVRLYSEI